MDKFDVTADPGTPPPLGRLVAEFGLRSCQTLRERAQWALDNMGTTGAGASHDAAEPGGNGNRAAEKLLALGRGPLI